MPDSHLGDHEVQKEGVSGRIVLVSATCVILNVGWEQLLEARVGYDDVLELVCGDETRRVYLKASSSQRLDEQRREILTRMGRGRVEDPPIPLLAESLTYWDDPEIQLLWLAPFVGDQLHFAASPGSRMRLTVSGKLGERGPARRR